MATATHWSISEVEAAVEDYFNMLQLELTEQKYNKAAHRRALTERLDKRSNGAVELKHQNISAVLIEMGIPYIAGYKPRFNYQKTLLPEAISSFLKRNPDIQQLLKTDSENVPTIPSVQNILAVMEDAPRRDRDQVTAVAETGSFHNPVRVNYFERESQNSLLGDAGEKFVANFERARLIRAGKENLADQIEQISITVGPSAGFDIRSFEENGSDRLIEAKTTKYGKETPFFLTSNELDFSRKNASHYFLYRVFEYRAEPRIYSLHGYLATQCVLKPSQYVAKPY